MGTVESSLVVSSRSSGGGECCASSTQTWPQSIPSTGHRPRHHSAPISPKASTFDQDGVVSIRKQWRASGPSLDERKSMTRPKRSPLTQQRQQQPPRVYDKEKEKEREREKETLKRERKVYVSNEKIYFPLPSPLVLRRRREASMNGDNMEDFFEGMPVEMLFYILQFLEIYELVQLSFVCKYFKTVLEQPESDTVLWRNLHDRTFGGGGRKTLYYRLDLRKGSGRPWDDGNALYWRRVSIDETRQLLWRAKNRGEKLRWAAEKGHWRILKDTLREKDAKVSLSEINRMMVICAGEGHTKSVEILADVLVSSSAGLDGTGLTPKNGFSALLKAALWGNPEVVKLLLTKGANINVRDKWNDTACIKAARAGHKDVVRILTCHKQCDLSLKNLDGDDALLAAAKAGHMDVVQVLISAGAPVGAVHKEYLSFLARLSGLG